MLTDLTIAKEKPSEPTLNYEYLRAEGLNYIQQLSSKIWTDYNVHDPGITILELLCYAITDLGYRISYPIKDILTAEEENLKKLHQQFLSAMKILPSKPVTINDYRKLLIDIEGIKNAWLEKTKANVSYFVNCMESKLAEVEPPANVTSQEIILQGLYDLKLELEEEIDLTDMNRVNQIVSNAKTVLHANRNLCEDFIDVKLVEKEEFIICAEIDLDFDADVNSIEAEIFHTIQNDLTPPINFHTLDEMTKMGKGVDEIFEGPVLNHGFIDDAELEKASLKKEIRLSDIIRIIMKIKGVKAVRDIIVNPKNMITGTDNKWVIKVSDNHQPILDVEASRIVYYKDLVPFRADTAKVRELLTDFQIKEQERQTSKKSEDIPIPEGEFRDIQEYYSFQNHFPNNYGINQIGLNESATEERKAQAKQLKAYLLFYDQVLANYFAQLAHVKELFSLDEDLKQTYFTQVVSSVRDVQELYADISKLEENIQNLTEDNALYVKRRNTFLDHLLARFAENFNEYVWIMYSLYGDLAKEDMIIDKIKYLKEYDTISSEKAKAFNYTTDNEHSWGVFNVSGLEHRVARLLGIKNCYTIFEDKGPDNIVKYSFKVLDGDKSLLESTEEYTDKDQLLKALKKALSYGLNEKNYQVDSSVEGFFFNLADENSQILAKREEFFPTENDCRQAIDELILFLFRKYGDEGFFIVEHILLRPDETTGYHFLPVCVNPDCSDLENADPYSFRISIILPAFSERFSEVDFRRFVEKTFRLETPAHILPRICWVSEEKMLEFGRLYKQWLDLHAIGFENDTENVFSNFIDFFSDIRSIYPEAFLSECTDPTGERNPFILDKTNLGTIQT